MTWYIHAQGRRLALAPGVGYRVGRASDCDVVVPGARVSRTHLELVVDPDGAGWRARDQSANGTYDAGGRMTGPRAASGPAAMALGAPDGPMIVVSQEGVVTDAAVAALADQVRWAANVAGAAAGAPSAAGSDAATTDGWRSAPGDRIRIGRSRDNDVVVPGLLASLHHAVLVREGAAWQLLDLNSARGTYVNGQRVAHAVLADRDEVSLGGSAFTFVGGQLVPRAVSGGMPVEAVDLTVRVGAATLLRGISFRAEPRTVTAVIGPSGSGKSTLLNALTGLRPADAGMVLVNDGDFYERYEEMRFWVGAVPQSDLVPAQLRVQEALAYAARLRFPRETTEQAQSARVAEVMAELGLAERAGLRIDRLSGGQRKRVSVALELLTKPLILYLDEPTSGLDPGLDRQVMMLLRELADGGRTVFVVTHAVENLNLADRLVVLAAGGWLAYDGPPADVLAYFGAPDMPTVFTTLEATSGEQWADRWAQRGAPGRNHAGRTRQLPAGSTGAGPSPAGRHGGHDGSGHSAAFAKPVGGLSQLPTLVSRSLRVILADRGYVGFLVVLPVILGLAAALVGSADGLSPGPDLLNPDARSLLLVITLGSIFTGAATSIQELVKERVIYQRERAVGLSRAAYVTAKALVLGAIAAAQGFVFATLALVGRPGVADPLVLPAHVEVATLAALATMCACMTGLAVSALLPTRETAMPILVVLTIVEVILSGAIPLRLDWVVDAIGPLTAAYWQFQGMAASADLAVLLGPAGADESWPHEVAEYLVAAGVLMAMAVGFLLAAIWLTGRHDPGRR